MAQGNLPMEMVTKLIFNLLPEKAGSADGQD
ncbi:hypothetical protein M2409_003905 [Sphingobacterium sp. JUb21]|nr:hypothetical protein [Sphingobacterium sp. JUb21]